jgi:hypothetical protein
MICIELPLHVIPAVKKSHGKKYIINLNNYCNWHFHVKNNVKKTYQAEIAHKLANIKFYGKIKLTFKLHMGSKRRVDRANVLCIHEKYFCDALVEQRCIPDDCDQYIESTTYKTGAISKDNPCVKVYIEEL